MPTRDPQTFSDEWVRAWNAHDVEAVLRICLHFDIVDVYRVSLINYPSQAAAWSTRCCASTATGSAKATARICSE